MKDNALTLAAIGLLAMVTTTVAHEVIGHGAACLAVGGQVVHVSSTLFACSTPNSWVAAGGPFNNILVGVIAAIAAFALPARHTGWRLFLASVAAFSLFWETGYLVKAMLFSDGDLYFFARAHLGQYGVWPLILAAAGAVLYIGVMAFVSRLLADVFGDRGRAQRAARIVWLTATVGAILAAFAFKGDLWPSVRDAGLEIGLAALPLLILPRRAGAGDAPTIGRSPAVAALALLVFAIFTASLGHGLGPF